MNYVFLILITVSLIAGFVNGTLNEVTNSMLQACESAVKIAFSLIGIMAFWLGIMRLAEKSGLIQILSKLILPFAKYLFKDIPKDNPALGNTTMSLSANALGLTNAATPIGLRVMKDLQEINPQKDTATDAMCMFLGMNTAGFQIIPATVIAILAATGSTNPAEIILPTLIVTTLSFMVAILTALILQRFWLKGVNNGVNGGINND